MNSENFVMLAAIKSERHYKGTIEDFNWVTRFNPNHAEAYFFQGLIAQLK